MKKIFVTVFVAATCQLAFAQPKPIDLITAKEATRIEKVLASDAMKGRKTFSPEIDKAADFIAAEFRAAGLKTWNKSPSFLQPFEVVNPKQTKLAGTINGKPLDERAVLVVTSQQSVTINPSGGYRMERIRTGESFFTKAMSLSAAQGNKLVIVDTSFRKSFPRLSFLKRGMFKSEFTTVFILGSDSLTAYDLSVAHDVPSSRLANVVGILPGKSKANEYVIFSAHYDHIGTGPAVNGDSIFNGANDDAAGTTAVIMLAKYFAKLKNNERTLVFATFTAEEVGGYGAQYFSRQFDPQKVIAMFNIEMIGTDSKWGLNSAYITGYEKTDMGTILQKNLAGTAFKFYPDPYPDQQLFYRSDNAALARLGVPAHTISTSKMDVEPHYHKVSDHVETLDMKNMAMVIRSIALSARSIIKGTDTPTRVNTDDLR